MNFRIYLVNGWENAAETSTTGNKRYVGEYCVQNSGNRSFVDIGDNGIVRLPNWATRLGAEFSIVSHRSPQMDGVVILGRATAFADCISASIAGPDVHEVIELWKHYLGLETNIIEVPATLQRRRRSPIWMRKRPA